MSTKYIVIVEEGGRQWNEKIFDTLAEAKDEVASWYRTGFYEKPRLFKAEELDTDIVIDVHVAT